MRGFRIKIDKYRGHKLFRSLLALSHSVQRITCQKIFAPAVNQFLFNAFNLLGLYFQILSFPQDIPNFKAWKVMA